MSSSALKNSPDTDLKIKAICDEIARLTGVQLGEKQLSMVVSRLRRRAIDLGLTDLEQYVAFFRENKVKETDALISLLTTHHTFFFREFSHFQFLETKGLEAVVSAAKRRGSNKIRIWSAACSRGQECYSLSMFMAHHLPKIAPGFSYEILGTDVDAESIGIANNGVYRRDEIKSVPFQYLGTHWTKGTGEIADFVKAKASIKGPCKFATKNLLQIDKNVTTEKFDIIFCRNVFIYFTPEQVKAITQNLMAHLHQDGFFFVGISESLSSSGLLLKSWGPSIYSTPQAAPVTLTSIKGGAAASTTPATSVSKNDRVPENVPSIIRVMCVDDSPTVLTLLKQVLTPEFGFQIVATAKNGLDAAATLKTVVVDVMTLDIHMPEQDGLTYLTMNHSRNHPPVVMISSVSRDDADLAMNCLKAGASDYVEKPTLSQMNERADEIRMKLRCVISAGKSGTAAKAPSIDQEFARKIEIQRPDEKLRLMMMNLADRAKVAMSLRELQGVQPPTVLLLEGIGNTADACAKELSALSGKTVEVVQVASPNLTKNHIYLCDSSQISTFAATYGLKDVSILIYGGITKAATAKIRAFNRRNVLLEDLDHTRNQKYMTEVSDDIVPATSFMYMSHGFLSK